MKGEASEFSFFSFPGLSSRGSISKKQHPQIRQCERQGLDDHKIDNQPQKPTNRNEEKSGLRHD